ncbi:MAG: hypothetical protein ACLPV4_06265, partial [Solirubrobacteraceae bacterium]
MVDDEARRGADAPRSEPLAVSVAGQDEDVHAFCGGHDLAFDAAAAGPECGWAPQARVCFGEQVVGGLLGDLPQPLRRWGFRWVSAQQAAA